MDRGEGVLNVGEAARAGNFIVLGLGSGGLSVERLGPASWVGPVDIFVTGMLIFLSYEGFELIANASPRVKRRAQTLPVASIGSVLVAHAALHLIVVVSVGHLPFEHCSKQKNHAISAVAETFMGRIRLSVHGGGRGGGGGVGDQRRYLRLDPADGDARRGRPAVVAAGGGRDVGGHPWKLVVLTVSGVIATTTMNLHALSAVSSAGFLMVFAAVNAANARLATETASSRWMSRARCGDLPGGAGGDAGAARRAGSTAPRGADHRGHGGTAIRAQAARALARSASHRPGPGAPE